MDIDQIQRQRLATFSLKGDASKWYKLQFTVEERLTATYDDFVYYFDQRYISSAAKAAKETELLTLEQGSMTVPEYEGRFVSLTQFTEDLYHTEERRARMFERGLRPQIRRHLISHRYRTLREVSDAAYSIELDWSREIAAKAVVQQ